MKDYRSSARKVLVVKGEFLNNRTKFLVCCPGILSTYFPLSTFVYGHSLHSLIKRWNVGIPSHIINKVTRSSLTKCVINHWYRIIFSAPSLHTYIYIKFLFNIEVYIGKTVWMQVELIFMYSLFLYSLNQYFLVWYWNFNCRFRIQPFLIKLIRPYLCMMDSLTHTAHSSTIHPCFPYISTIDRILT